MVDRIEQSRAPLIDHLIELRRRLAFMAIGLVIAFLGCWYVAPDIFAFLVEPLREVLDEGGYDTSLIYTHLLEAFFTELKIAFWGAFFVTFPLIATQFWMFVAPGLYKNEKMAVLPFLFITPILFFSGGALVYYFIFPASVQFLHLFPGHGHRGASRPRTAAEDRRVPVAGDEADLRLRHRLPASRDADP